MQNKPYVVDHYFVGPIRIRFDFQLPEDFLIDKDVFNSYGLEVLGGYWRGNADPDACEFRDRVYGRLECNSRLIMETGINAPITVAVVTVNSQRPVPKWMKRGIVFFNDIDDLPKAWQKNVMVLTDCDVGGIAWKGGKLGELLNDADYLLTLDDFSGIRDVHIDLMAQKATGITTAYCFTEDAKEAKKALSLCKGWSMLATIRAKDGDFTGEITKAKGVEITYHNQELIRTIAMAYGAWK